MSIMSCFMCDKLVDTDYPNEAHSTIDEQVVCDACCDGYYTYCSNCGFVDENDNCTSYGVEALCSNCNVQSDIVKTYNQYRR